jgi:hypothetical protein
LSLSLTRCGGESTTGSSTTGACSNGICGSGGDTTSAGTMTTTGGMGGSPTTGASMTTSGGMGGSPTTGAGMTTSGGMGGAPGTTTSGAGTTTTTAGVTSSSAATTGSGGCVESWLCTPWDGKGTNNGTRACTDTNNCGTMANKPATTATLPALDQNYFKCNVEPILDAKCSMMGCHGTETGRALRVYSRGKLRDANVANPPPAPNGCMTTPLAQCTGTNDCHCAGPHAPEEWQRNYDAARGLLLDTNGNPIPAGQADTSDLIQQPVVGGKSHAGVHLFKPNDAEYTTIKSWLSGSTLASCDPTPN